MRRAFIYLDESGSMGFDTDNPRVGRYFVLTALICDGDCVPSVIKRAVKRTLQNKSLIDQNEIKGTNTKFSEKKYFHRQLEGEEGWHLITVIADKIALVRKFGKSPDLIDKSQLYDAMACQIMEKLQYTDIEDEIFLIVDKSKTEKEIAIFNEKIARTVKEKSGLEVFISHKHSRDEPGIQAADIFCFGVNRKYNSNDESWYEIYSKRIREEIIFRLI